MKSHNLSKTSFVDEKMKLPNLDDFIEDVLEEHIKAKNEDQERLLVDFKIHEAYMLHSSNVEFEAEVANQINIIKEKYSYLKDNDKKDHWKKRYEELKNFDQPEETELCKSKSGKTLEPSPYTALFISLLKQEELPSTKVGQKLFEAVEANTRVISYYKGSLEDEDD